MTRAYRLFFFFLFSLVFNFILALNIPLWVLLIGPVFLGIPHLVSSMRYIPKLTALDQFFCSKNLYFVIGGFFVTVAAFRLFMTDKLSILNEIAPNALELSGCIFVLVFISIYSNFSKLRVLSSLGILVLLSILSLQYPFETLGFLILAHNFIAFIFWIARAKETKEKAVAILSLGLFSIVTIAILNGVFDSWLQIRPFEILNGLLSDINIGAQIFPNGDSMMWSRGVSAYALGQGVHYFIWLKAIPEQELSFQHNTSFKTSFKFLKIDMGSKIIYASSLALLALVSYGLWVNFVEARVIYLSLAALHGYFEITALAFVKEKLS